MNRKKGYSLLIAAIVITGSLSYLSFKITLPVQYSSHNAQASPERAAPKVFHLPTPEPLKGIYMTACAAGMGSFRKNLISLIEETELNSIVIDIKDYTGTVSFDTGDKAIDSLGGKGCRVADMETFIKELHDRDIYVIGRVAVFQDPLYTAFRPDLAVKRKSDGGIWRDRKGLSFIDVGAQEYWNYIVKISKQSEAIGFDEINFDYIRYPSDGNMTDILFPHTGTTTKREMLKNFFAFLDGELKDTLLKTSADLFGMVTTNFDDLGIGQVLENALPYFDYISPMVYPSHYPSGFNNWPDPNKVPYEIVNFSMAKAVERTEELASTTRATFQSTTTQPNMPLRNAKRIGKYQLRPWLQDNDYPIHYTAEMVRAQIQATYDAGLTSWMLWDPSNRYTKDALLVNPTQPSP